MAVRILLDQMLVRRRMSLSELADRVGLTVASLTLLKEGRARAIRLTTLDSLCRELDCQPGELLAHEPGHQDDGRPRHS
jgi:putative transcriptional regulator